MEIRVKYLALLLAAAMLASLLPMPLISALNPGITETSEPTVIDTLPYTITEPGVYVLTSDLSGDGGISVEANNVTILGNGHTITSTTTHTTGISIDGPYNVRIVNLTIRDFTTGIYVYETESYNWTGISLEHISVINAETGIRIEDVEYTVYMRDIYIEGTDATSYGIDIEYSSGVVIYNATVRAAEGASPDTAIYVYDYYDEGSGVRILNSRIEGSWEYGIHLDYAYYVLVSNTVINGTGSGIVVDDSEDVVVIRTVVANTTGEAGISVDFGYNVRILGSTITGSQDGYGIRIDYTHYALVKGNVITDNSQGGVYVGSSNYVNITSNQILRNHGYGVEVTTTYTDIYIHGNIVAENAESPQAYDEEGVADWSGNYWSDWGGSGAYSFTDNEDPEPLEEPAPDLLVTGIYPPSPIQGNSLVNVEVEVSNLGYGDALGAPLTLYWSEPPVFSETTYTWINLDPSSASEAEDEEVYEDYGNYTLTGDDRYFVYKMPFPIEVYGYKYQYIAVSTNGYVQLLNTTNSLLADYYTVHTNGYYLDYYGTNDTVFPAGVTVLFAYSGDLEADEYYGMTLGVYNLGDMVVVWFNGTTYEDDSDDYPVQYQVIFMDNGTIVVSLGDLDFTELEGDGFTGLYLAPLGMEITAGYMLPSHTSWKINTALHEADTIAIDLPAGEAENFTLTWDTGLLPHLSPYTLWASAGELSDTSAYNTPSAPLTVEVMPGPGRPVGGALELGWRQDTVLYAAPTALAAALLLLLAARRLKLD